MMEERNPYVPNVLFELIPIKNLVSSQDYQRALSEKHIKKTVEEFDLYQINPVKVSRRDGTNYVFNGQHTIEIVAAASGSRETPVWCMVYDDMEYTVEADVFANQQKNVKALSPYEIFMANIEAGNEEQLMIKSLVETYGLEITHQKRPGGICAISSLELIYNKYGFSTLDRTLNLCIGTWEGEENSLSANILKAVAIMIVAFGEELRDDVFKEKVGSVSIKEIVRLAKERAGGTMGYAEVLLMQYNKKMKKGLDWITLHTKKTVDPDPFEEQPSLFQQEELEMESDDIDNSGEYENITVNNAKLSVV